MRVITRYGIFANFARRGAAFLCLDSNNTSAAKNTRLKVPFLCAARRRAFIYSLCAFFVFRLCVVAFLSIWHFFFRSSSLFAAFFWHSLFLFFVFVLSSFFVSFFGILLFILCVLLFPFALLSFACLLSFLFLFVLSFLFFVRWFLSLLLWFPIVSSIYNNNNKYILYYFVCVCVHMHARARQRRGKI